MQNVSGAIRIDRATMWGNPFIIGVHGTRAEVIEQYRIWLWNRISDGSITIAQLTTLHGKTLACHCAPKACHGDVLVKAAAWAAAQSQTA